MNCLVYGKTQENLQNHVNMGLITDEKILKKQVENPKFKCGIEINGELAIIQSKIATLMLNRPIYIGFYALDLSRLLMYDFHYNYLKLKYPLTYLIKTDEVYKDMINDNEHFDFSGYSDSPPCFKGLKTEVIRHKKVVGKMKDEFNGLAASEFVGLKPKLYSLDYKREANFDVDEDGEVIVVWEAITTSVKRIANDNKVSAKGVIKSVKDAHLRHQHYLTVLQDLSIVTEYI